MEQTQTARRLHDDEHLSDVVVCDIQAASFQLPSNQTGVDTVQSYQTVAQRLLAVQFTDGKTTFSVLLHYI